MTAPKPLLALLCILLLSAVCFAQTKKPEKKTVDINGVGPVTVTAFKAPPVPKTPKEAAQAVKKAIPVMFVDGKMSFYTDAGKIATFYEDGRIEMEKGHTLKEMTWLLLWSNYANR